MQLGGSGIRGAFETGLWSAFRGPEPIPFEDLVIGPNSIDVTLHPEFLFPEYTREIDPRNPNTLQWRREVVGDEGFTLHSGECCLGAINERFDCRDPLVINGVQCLFKPDIDGRSSIGRLFVSVHITAGFGDYGFQGAFTLEIKNDSPFPVRLYPGMRIAQVFFTQVSAPMVYEGAYSKEDHHSGPRPPILGPDRF